MASEVAALHMAWKGASLSCGLHKAPGGVRPRPSQGGRSPAPFAVHGPPPLPSLALRARGAIPTATGRCSARGKHPRARALSTSDHRRPPTAWLAGFGMAKATLNVSRREPAAYRRRYGVRRRWLFGSARKDAFGPGNGIDIPVGFFSQRPARRCYAEPHAARAERQPGRPGGARAAKRPEACCSGQTAVKHQGIICGVRSCLWRTLLRHQTRSGGCRPARLASAFSLMSCGSGQCIRTCSLLARQLYDFPMGLGSALRTSSSRTWLLSEALPFTSISLLTGRWSGRQPLKAQPNRGGRF